MLNRIAVLLLISLVSCVPAAAQSIPAATTITTVSITTGNTFQLVLAAITQPNQRRSLTINNNNTTSTENCWIFLGPAASATKGTSILLQPGGSYTRYSPYVPSDAISATCVSTSDTLYVDNQ